MNNGHDCLRFSEVAEMLSEVLHQPVGYDGTESTFLEQMGDIIDKTVGTKGASNYFLVNWKMEKDNEECFIPNSFMERILGRKPKTLRSFFEENRDEFYSIINGN